MCGIFGVFNLCRQQQIDKNLFKESTNLLKHRGPDGEGFYFDDNNFIGLGHRRLAILDLKTGDQPMCNEDKTIWIVFNGEIYNYKELKEVLISKGHIFKTKSDTEVLIHGYEEFGEELPVRLNGIFAFAIWDSKKKRLFLARDHFGVKPLYYLYNKDQFVFSSEYKAILNYTKITPTINQKALYFCLTFRHTPSPYTLIQHINKISAASYLIYENNKLKIKKYWSHLIYIDYNRKEKDWIEELKFAFELAVKRQMISDVPVGLSLSGGVDSGALLALMSKYEGKGVHAFTVGFEGNTKEDNELEKAKVNAERFGAEFNYEVISDVDYLNFLNKYLWHLEEPVGNESAVAYYFVAKLAQGKVKVLLNGQGADEPLAGYDRYIGMYYADKYNLPSFIFKVLSVLTYSLNRKNQFLHLSDYLEQKSDIRKILSSASIINKQKRKNIFKKDFFQYINEKQLENEIANIIKNNINGKTVENMLFYDLFSSLSENLLLSEDKMSMAASIEVRVPFLDIELVKIMLSIPIEFKIRGTSGKYIHKKMCENYLPRNVVYQKKIGFNNPMDKWLRENLGSELNNYINSPDSITNNFFKKNIVKNILKEHKKGKSDNQRFLFLLLSLEKWKNIYLN